jgi:hypothetical protein
MEFDIFSFITGLLLLGVGAGFLFWSEKCSLANRVAYSCCEQARLLISCKRELLVKTQNNGLNNLDTAISIEEKIYPIENEEFKIELLSSERVQTDVHISEYISVYSKRYNLWLIIEDTTAFLDEGMSDSFMYYFCKPNFEEKQIIKTPYTFNVAKYLIREKQ